MWKLETPTSATASWGSSYNPTVTKAQALRRAQTALLNNPRFERPHFWASYVLVGNWL